MKRDPHLNPLDRARLADEVVRQFHKAFPGSRAELRGSLAEGRADEYSDIDICWEVADTDFPPCLASLRSILDSVRPVESLRSDPDFQNSQKCRLLFVRFRDMPLFWRLDLEVIVQSLRGHPISQVGKPHAKGTDWSATESALANTVAAIKAHLRQNDEEAYALLSRAYVMVGLPVPDLRLGPLMLKLVDYITTTDPEMAAFGARIKELASDI